MANARTVDNLGSDVSVSYAIAQKLGAQDPDLLIDPSRFKDVAEVTVTSPYVLSEFDELFNITDRRASWAGFSAPDHFEANRKTKLFSFQLIPSIGTPEHQEAIKEKLMSRKSKKRQVKEEKEEKENEQEYQKVLDLLEELANKDKIHINILAKRGEYQRG